MHDADLTERDYPIDYAPKRKRRLTLLLEGHLTFGLFFYRTHFIRWQRLFTLISVIIFELLIEGLLFYGFEPYNSGHVKSTSTLD